MVYFSYRLQVWEVRTSFLTTGVKFRVSVGRSVALSVLGLLEQDHTEWHLEEMCLSGLETGCPGTRCLFPTRPSTPHLSLRLLQVFSLSLQLTPLWGDQVYVTLAEKGIG